MVGCNQSERHMKCRFFFFHCQEFPLITLSYLFSSPSTKYMGTAGGKGAVTAGKETHRYLLGATDPWDNDFSAVFNM